jgi:rhodanese-related sulfurtransferase
VSAEVNAARGIAQRLDEARQGLRRVLPEEVAARLDQGAVLVDIRPLQQRVLHGQIADALVIERNVLEWRLDPTSSAALPWAAHDLEVIVLCQEGYASSLAAESLQRLGISAATDLDGGFAAWKSVGLPWVATPAPDDDAPGGERHGRA